LEISKLKKKRQLKMVEKNGPKEDISPPGAFTLGLSGESIS
jgi:hypothetical protein